MVLSPEGWSLQSYSDTISGGAWQCPLTSLHASRPFLSPYTTAHDFCRTQGVQYLLPIQNTEPCAAEWKHCSNDTEMLLEGDHTSLNFSQRRRTRKRWKRKIPAQLSSISQSLEGLIDHNFSLDSGITQWHKAVIRNRLPASETSFYICYFKTNNCPDKSCK